MLYRVLERIILRGGADTEDLLTKLDVFYAGNRITQSQYEALLAMME